MAAKAIIGLESGTAEYNRASHDLKAALLAYNWVLSGVRDGNLRSARDATPGGVDMT